MRSGSPAIAAVDDNPVRNSPPSVYSKAMKSPARYVLLAVVVTLITTACNRDESGNTTTTLGAITTTTAVPTTQFPTTSVSTPAPTTSTTSSTSTTRAAIPEPEWTIVERIEGDDGATVVVLLDPESYERLTDIDIQNIIEDVIELFPPILEVHVVDSQEAADVVLSEVIDTDDVLILSTHYFARLEEGFRIVYEGPFSDFGVVVLGS